MQTNTAIEPQSLHRLTIGSLLIQHEGRKLTISSSPQARWSMLMGAIFFAYITGALTLLFVRRHSIAGIVICGLLFALSALMIINFAKYWGQSRTLDQERRVITGYGKKGEEVAISKITTVTVSKTNNMFMVSLYQDEKHKTPLHMTAQFTNQAEAAYCAQVVAGFLDVPVVIA